MNKWVQATGEILLSNEGCLKILALNRPKALNALNLSMIRELVPLMHLYEYEPIAGAILLKGAAPEHNAFCAGGDIRFLYESAKCDVNRALAYDFFREEYRLNYQLSQMEKPIVSVLNGICMGGGVGLSIHGKFVVATEKSVFAMPECGIGFFPDVGASHKLPRLGSQVLDIPANTVAGQGLGTFLALTGHRIKGQDLLDWGLASHFVQTRDLELLESSLGGLRMEDPELDAEDREDLVDMALDAFEPVVRTDNVSTEFLNTLESIFGHHETKDSLEGIFDRLEDHNSEWANTILTKLRTSCPLSLKVTLQQMRLGNARDMKNCLQMEYRIACRMMSNPDFVEGVRAAIVDKDQQPKWQHQDITQVPQEMVDAFFEPLADELVLYEPEKPFYKD